MKLKSVPKSLSNTPKQYSLDSGDKRAIKKYRNEKNTKMRRDNKI